MLLFSCGWRAVPSDREGGGSLLQRFVVPALAAGRRPASPADAGDSAADAPTRSEKYQTGRGGQDRSEYARKLVSKDHGVRLYLDLADYSEGDIPALRPVRDDQADLILPEPPV